MSQNKIFPELEYWEGVNYWSPDDGNIKWVELSMDSGYGLRATLTPDGIIELQTSGGGGHGMPKYNTGGKTYSEWINLIEEAQKVIEFYYPDKEGN